MARLIKPSRITFGEFPIADLRPFPEACRVADQGQIFCALTVVCGTLGRKTYGDVGIALARSKAVTQADNEKIRHLHGRLSNLAAANLDGNLSP
jgi:hypothetical protein